MTKRSLILSLFEIGAVQFGSFTLKSGIQSPFYLDLRRSVSFPEILIAIADAFCEKMKPLQFDYLCGVPYTAIPFAAAVSIRHHVPMVLLRKERKTHGTGRILEGVYQAGQHCLILEDVITSGSSLLKSAEEIREDGLIVEEAIVLVDRCQGGIEALEKKGIHTYPIFTLPEITTVLEEEGKITASLASSMKAFLKEHRVC